MELMSGNEKTGRSKYTCSQHVHANMDVWGYKKEAFKDEDIRGNLPVASIMGRNNNN